MEKNSVPALHVQPTETEVLRHLADYFVELANRTIAAKNQFSVALSGGSSPKKLYELLTSDEYREQVTWEKVYFFFGDERYVPHTSPDSNYRMAWLALLEPLGIAADHVFAVDTALEPAKAAAAYTAAIEQFFGPAAPRFDLVLLGLGDNSHTASLFPHTPVLYETSVGAKEVFVAEVDAYRITLTAPLLNQAYAVAYLVYGAGKAAAVRHILCDPRNIDEYPAQLVAPADGEVHWFLDQAAAADL